jgi:hypothetical protein
VYLLRVKPAEIPGAGPQRAATRWITKIDRYHQAVTASGPGAAAHPHSMASNTWQQSRSIENNGLQLSVIAWFFTRDAL